MPDVYLFSQFIENIHPKMALNVSKPTRVNWLRVDMCWVFNIMIFVVFFLPYSAFILLTRILISMCYNLCWSIKIRHSVWWNSKDWLSSYLTTTVATAATTTTTNALNNFRSSIYYQHNRMYLNGMKVNTQWIITHCVKWAEYLLNYGWCVCVRAWDKSAWISYAAHFSAYIIRIIR